MGKRTGTHYKTNKKSKNRLDKFNKSKIKCFKCEKKTGHYKTECKVKDKINPLQISSKEKDEIYKIMELRNNSSSD
jgi:hypothetical protein